MSMPTKYQSEPMVYSFYFRTPHPITSIYPQQLREQLNASMEVLEERMSTFAQAGSGWTFEENHSMILEMVDYEPMGGSSYLQLPKDVYDSKAVINIKNEDHECFKWSLLAALHPAEHHAERITHYQPFKEELNFKGIYFLVSIDQIGKFEKQNPRMSVTVIGIGEEKTKKHKGKKVKQSCFLPLGVPDEKQEQHVTLLYWKKGEQSH